MKLVPKSLVRLMAVLLAPLIGSLAHAQLWSDAYAEVQNYSLVIKNDATFQGNAKVYEGLFVGGNLVAPNAEFGSRLPGGSLGLYVRGGYAAAGSKMLSQSGPLTTYYVNNLTGSFVQGTGTTGINSPVARTAESIFADFKIRSDQFFSAGASQINLDQYGAVYAGAFTGDSNQGRLSLTSGKLNILNIDGSSAFTQFIRGQGDLIFNGLTAGTRLVINYQGNGAGDEFIFNAKIQGLAANLHGAVIFNLAHFGQGATINPGSPFQASILAPEVDVTWVRNDMDGTLIAKSLLVQNSNQFHESVTTIELTEVPEPAHFGIIGAALLLGFAQCRRRRTASRAK